MAKKDIFTGVDIGSSTVRVIIGEENEERGLLRIIGIGECSASGIRRGVVINPDEAAKALASAVERAEKMSGVTVGNVIASFSGADIFSQSAQGVVAVSLADGEVTEDDVNRALGEAHAKASLTPNQEILYVVPKSYRLDDQKNLQSPIGMKGVRLEVDALVIGMGSLAYRNVTRMFEIAKVDLLGLVAAPLAAAQAVLSEKQKELGSVLVLVGSGTTSIAIFEEGELLHIAALPVGGGHITNDIAIGLRTSIEVAEALKLAYGHALPESVDRREEIDLAAFDSNEEGLVSRRHVAEIIEARFEEIFQFVNDELKQAGKEGLLPGGAILTGGTVLLPGTIELAKDVLRLPVHIGGPQPLGGLFDQVDTPLCSAAVGALLSSYEHRFDDSKNGASSVVLNMMPEKALEMGKKAKQFFNKFLP